MEYWSNYNYCIDFSQDFFLLYNSFSNAFIELPTTVKAEIEHFKSDRDSRVFDKKTRLLLKKTGAIYEGNQDKQLNSLKMRHGNLSFSQSKHISFTILPTLECNFRCSYCFEHLNQVLQPKTMSQEVQNILADKIIEFHQKGYKISLAWFGGEPLMKEDTIHSISSRLNAMNIEYTSSMITNGYLLTPEVVDKLTEWKINHIQVTLDGDEYTHNSRRMLANGGGTYRTIMDNLKYLHARKGISVSIRVNVDKTNEAVYSQIAATIEIELPGMHIYPGFVTGGCNACSGKIFTNHIEKADFLIQQYKEYGNLSLSYFPSFSLGHCMATNFNTWIVGPEGELYNCQAEVGVPSRVVGNIKENTITAMDYVSEFIVGVSPFENEQCRQCTVLPLCGGGCSLDRIAKKNGKKIDTCTVFKNKNKLGELLKIHYDIRKQRQEITTL
jgi:uncharacterized protein